MIDWLVVTFEAALVVLGLVALMFYFLKKKVSLTTLTIAGLTELLVIAQLVLTILLASESEGYLELIGYAVAALLVPLGAAALASMDGTRVGNLVISLAPFVVAIMFSRMWIIWIS